MPFKMGRQFFHPGSLSLAILLTSGCLAKVDQQKDTPAAAPGMYHGDPQHLWNRLHEAVFVRQGPDSQAYGQDRLEPLLWRESRHLLEERSRDRALALLEEFIKGKSEKRIEDPLKRAVLQRDLWLVFNWLEANHGDFEAPTHSIASSILE